MMWESQTNTWEQTEHHKMYEVPLHIMCETVWKSKVSSFNCSHTRSHRFYLALIHKALFHSPLPTACLWWPGWELHTALTAAVQQGYFTWREKVGTEAAHLCLSTETQSTASDILCLLGGFCRLGTLGGPHSCSEWLSVQQRTNSPDIFSYLNK